MTIAQFHAYFGFSASTLKSCVNFEYVPSAILTREYYFSDFLFVSLEETKKEKTAVPIEIKGPIALSEW